MRSKRGQPGALSIQQHGSLQARGAMTPLQTVRLRRSTRPPPRPFSYRPGLPAAAGMWHRCRNRPPWLRTYARHVFLRPKRAAGMVKRVGELRGRPPAGRRQGRRGEAPRTRTALPRARSSRLRARRHYHALGSPVVGAEVSEAAGLITSESRTDGNIRPCGLRPTIRARRRVRCTGKTPTRRRSTARRATARVRRVQPLASSCLCGTMPSTRTAFRPHLHRGGGRA